MSESLDAIMIISDTLNKDNEAMRGIMDVGLHSNVPIVTRFSAATTTNRYGYNEVSTSLDSSAIYDLAKTTVEMALMRRKALTVTNPHHKGRGYGFTSVFTVGILSLLLFLSIILQKRGAFANGLVSFREYDHVDNCDTNEVQSTIRLGTGKQFSIDEEMK